MTDAHIPVLEVDDLSVWKGTEKLVSSVSFTLSEGRKLGVVGETGSGKSLSCRSLVGGLVRHGLRPEGRISYQGHDLITCPKQTWAVLRGRSIGFVPQSSLNSLDPVMRIDRQMLETVKALGGAGSDARDRVEALLEQVHMPEPRRVLRSYPHQLSGGMRQRLMIALAIAGHPRILVADEPTTALDVSVQRRILDLIKELCEVNGMSLVLVTHDLGIVQDVCDDVLVMRNGAGVEYGPVAEVLHEPRHSYTRELLAARLTIDAEVPSHD
ncbi:ABC transporter ATP-binding protein, partial [Nonomuraea sp. RK-328]|nr:ABC transporter ATP-binding protein [Nonomuraea sp. RK-328]